MKSSIDLNDEINEIQISIKYKDIINYFYKSHILTFKKKNK